MGFCCVPGCSNTTKKQKQKVRDDNIEFYSIPRRPLKRYQAFKRAIGRDHKFKFTSHTRVCSRHFFGGRKSEDPNKQAYIPTEHLPFDKKCGGSPLRDIGTNFPLTRKTYQQQLDIDLQASEEPKQDAADAGRQSKSTVTPQSHGYKQDENCGMIVQDPSPQCPQLRRTLTTNINFTPQRDKTSLNAKVGKKLFSPPFQQHDEHMEICEPPNTESVPLKQRPCLGRTATLHIDIPPVLTAEAAVQTDPVLVLLGGTFQKPVKPQLSDHVDYSVCQTVTDRKEDLEHIDLYIKHIEKQRDAFLSDVAALKRKVSELTAEIKDYESHAFTLDSIKDDNEAIRFYTSFRNYSALKTFYDYIKESAETMKYWRDGESANLNQEKHQDKVTSKPGRKRKLTTLEEFFMVLVRLRAGLFIKDLAGRFRISEGHFSKIFTTWINLLYHELHELFPFPSQELTRLNMPAEFDDFPTTRVIIDCTEFPIQIASSLNAQSETWSNYKHKNTMKVLIGVTPNGRVSYVSPPWGGRVSDKEITRSCKDLLSELRDGDNVMADRGFVIQDLLPQGVTLNIPPFKGTRDQLDAVETEATMKIASVRIVVEQAIGCIKKFHILDGTIPIACKRVLHQIIFVCSYLTSFDPPLMPPKSARSQRTEVPTI